METNTSTSSGTAQEAQQNPPTQVVNSEAQVANETPNDFSLEDLQRELKEAKREAQNLRKRIREQDEATSQAEKQRMKEQGLYKELAEKHEARVKELEPYQQGYSQLAELVSDQIEAQIKDWPAEVKKLVPDANTPIEQRLQRVEDLQPLVKMLAQQARATQPGNAPNPRPAQATPEGNDFYSKLRASQKYGI